MIKPIDPPEDQLAIVLGQRQLVAVCCMALVVLGLVATLAYVSGRSITAAQMQSQLNTQSADAPPRGAIVVEGGKPPATPVPSAIEARAETSLPTAPPPASVNPAAGVNPAGSGNGSLPRPSPQPLQPIPAAGPAVAEPLRGQTFWQVGVVDRGVAVVFVEYLTRLGLRVRAAAGDSAGTYRVLVGPLTDVGETENARRTLQTAGFQYFLRRY